MQTRKSHILVADDSKINRSLIEDILSDAGYIVTSVGNGENAIERAKNIPFDLILLDIIMPKIDGFEACKELKKSDLTKDIPVIFLTARTDNESLQKGFELGAVDYIRKPFSSIELFARVRTHIELKKAKEKLFIKLSEQEKAHAQLKSSEQKYKTLFSKANDAIFIMNRDIFIDCNAKATELFATSRENIIGQNIRHFSPEQQPSGSNSYSMALKKISETQCGTPQRFYWQHTKMSGELFDADVTLNGFVLEGKTYIQTIVRDISVQKKNEQTIKNQNKYLLRVINSLTHPFYIVDVKSFRIVKANSASKILNKIPDKKPCNFHFDKSSLNCTDVKENCPIKIVVRTHKSFKLENELTDISNQKRIYETHYYPVFNPDGEVGQVISYLIDITARKVAEKSLYESRKIIETQNRIANFFLTSPYALVFFDVFNEILTTLSSKVGFIGYIDDSGMLICPGYKLDSTEKVADQPLQLSQNSWQSTWGEAIYKNKTIWVNKNQLLTSQPINRINCILATPIRYGDKPIGVIVVSNKKDGYDKHDSLRLETVSEYIAPILQALITQKNLELKRFRAESALKQSEERFRNIVQQFGDGLCIIDSNGKITEWNNTQEKIYQMTSKSSIGKFAWDVKFELLPPTQKTRESYNRIRNYFRKILANKNELYCCLPRIINILCKNNAEKIIELVVFPLQFGNKTYVGCSSRDITTQKLAEIAVKQSEERFRSIFANSNDAIAICSLQGQFLNTNSEFRKLLNYSSENLKSINASDLSRSKHEVTFEEMVERLEDTNYFIAETNLLASNKCNIPVEISARIIDYDGKQVILSIFRDLTERKAIQRRIVSTIIQTEEKERNRFAKDLHDGMGALLSSINIYLNLFELDKFGKDEIPKIIQDMKDLINEAILSSKEIANNIKPNVLSNFGLIVSIKSFCEKLNTTRVIEIDFDSKNFSCKLDHNTEVILFRVINELINNTLKHATATKAHLSISNTPELLKLLYSDNGIGFDVKNSIRLGEENMGLKNIITRVKTINGIINIISKKGDGQKTEVKIRL